MSKNNVVSEAEAREVAENSRQKEWSSKSFLKEIFLGNYDFSLLKDTPKVEFSEDFKVFYKSFERFIKYLDSAQIDLEGIYPQEVIDELAQMGAFGMKIPKEYGGLGFNAYEYAEIMKLLGRYDSNIAVLLSAHQSIGVPQPVYHFGSEYLKNTYLPECAKGFISAFALTEPDVGSDPARLSTTVTRDSEGNYILNGEKLWCTNGTFADLLVVMARHEDTGKISAFVVETQWQGVKTEHRCRFMGLKALENGVLSFTNVKIPKQNLIGKEGAGLKIALTTLNAGRLALPAGSAGLGQQCLEWLQGWCNERNQWGRSIGKHEAVAHRLTDIMTEVFAMDAVADITSLLASDKTRDIRLEAAAAKEINTVKAWDVLDKTLQTRGGRGYETETSLKQRGETPIPIERMMRDTRINRIIEGTSDIMHLYIAREAVDKHLEVSGDIIDPKASLQQKIKTFFKAGGFYAKWYPTRWIHLNKFRYTNKYHRYLEKTSRKLSRSIFHGMLVHGPKLQNKQSFLFRIVDIGLELYTLASALYRLENSENPTQDKKLVQALFYKTKKKINAHFRDLWRNRDTADYKLTREYLEGNFEYLY